ncbi:TonB-dependent receptor [Sphingobacterium sp. N143]|uniref:SusC/RagA family TonB-linked outer membrane protein n=1 Tax=Sphingobacterium sp. N143 TaxID=2746727 RepID=UPI0025791B0D|nr:TonB-dependent receptor [Sphingobacterium sp. N143]MDM1292715.1 TonB-dependent receptor [Sphingobacterium sp. N143]
MKPKIEWTNGLIKATPFVFFLLSAGHALGQEKAVKGTVKDPDGRPIASATIKVVGNDQLSTSTDNNGNFNLQVPATAKQLSVSYVGSALQTVDLIAGQPLQIVLQRDDQALDEVVVVGYQTVKRKDLTGAVASVTGKDIAATPVANIAQAIQGKLPGVNVVSQDGRPNADIAIRVRGGGSISQSNQPLILVDGIIVNSMNDVPSDLVESIDVLKDASSTAIYGARGANGVIIVTTKQAKEGKINLTYNSYAKFNTPAKYLDILNPYEYLNYVWANADANGSAYRTSFEKLYGLGEYKGNNTLGIEAYRDVATTDLQRQVYKSSFSHNHDLTISGGSAKTKVLFAANYMDDQGMKLNSYAKRANLSLKVTQKIFDNLDFNLDTRFSDLSNMGNEGTTNGSGSLLSSAYRFRPISTQDIKGDLAALREGNIEQYGKFSTWDSYSAYHRIKDYEALERTQNLRGTAALNWRIRKNLSFQSNFNISRPWGQSKIWGGATYNNYLDDATGEKLYAGSAELSKSDGWNLRWTNTLNYDLNIDEQHKLNVMVGQETSNSAGNSVRISANHFPASFTKDNAFAMIDQYDADHGTSSFSTLVDSPVRIMSYFGRANYNFADRYLFTFTFRADGSSKFAPTQRWGYFPAAALAWRISEESFAKEINWLDDLKLRLSYGEVGNDGISSNLWSQTWSSETDRRLQYVINNQYQKSYDLSSDQMANQDLKWETTITRNIGLDFSLFNRKLWGTVDLYKNTTKDLLMQTTLPGITGFTSIFQNIGQTSNKGLEISLSGQLLKNADWNITAGANISFNRGNVDALAENITGLYGTSWASTSTYPNSDYILKVGRPVGLVRGLVYDGFYTTSDFEYANGTYTLKEGVADVGNFIGAVHGLGSNDRPAGQTAYPGVVKYKDLDNSGYIDDKDLTVIGDMNAKHTGGFNLNVSYKGLDLATFFNWSYGNQVYNANKLASLYGYKESGVYENKLAILKNAYSLYEVADGNLNRLQSPEQLDAVNRNAALPLAYNENGVTSSLGIEDGSYLRLNTVTLGYTLPKSLLRTKSINRLRIYGSIYNVWTITGYSGLDPEVNANAAANHAIYPTPGLDWGTYPRARSFVLGLNCSF